MRPTHLLAGLASTLTCVFSSAAAFAMDPPSASSPIAREEATFGTTPARDAAAPLSTSPTSPVSQSYASEGPDAFERGRAEAPLIAKDPPPDWAVLHAGLRPELGTFGGIATLALAHARTERFYGVFSFSAIRSDVGTHLGVAQIGLGRSLSDTFGGGVQLSLTENRARNFYGLGQVALAYNRTLDMVALSQVGSYNRARTFSGVAQLGPYNRTDEAFQGIAQIGAFDHARKNFNGLVQVGALSAVGPELYGEGSSRAPGPGLAQNGVAHALNGSVDRVTQGGASSITSGDFVGAFQIGALGAGARHFRGIAQIGLAAVSGDSVGAQLGAGAVALDEHTGVQLGALANYAGTVHGAQIGIVNLAEEARGVQIGVFNHAKSLRGLQIGLANHAEDGVLPWTAILNMGFGDDDEASHATARSDAPRSAGTRSVF